MDNLEAFQTFLEVITLILTISSQYPLLGIISALVIVSLWAMLNN